MTATITLSGTKDGKPASASGPLRLMKPNKALVQIKGEWTAAVSSDGKELIHLLPKDRYTKEAVNPDGSGITFTSGFQVPLFFAPKDLVRSFQACKASYLGKQKLGDDQCDKIVFTDTMTNSHLQYTLYINSDKVLKRFEMEVTTDHTRTIAELSNIKLNPTLNPADFAYKLPATAKLFEF